MITIAEEKIILTRISSGLFLIKQFVPRRLSISPHIQRAFVEKLYIYIDRFCFVEHSCILGIVKLLLLSLCDLHHFALCIAHSFEFEHSGMQKQFTLVNI